MNKMESKRTRRSVLDTRNENRKKTVLLWHVTGNKLFHANAYFNIRFSSSLAVFFPSSSYASTSNVSFGDSSSIEQTIIFSAYEILADIGRAIHCGRFVCTRRFRHLIWGDTIANLTFTPPSLSELTVTLSWSSYLRFRQIIMASEKWFKLRCFFPFRWMRVSATIFRFWTHRRCLTWAPTPKLCSYLLKWSIWPAHACICVSTVGTWLLKNKQIIITTISCGDRNGTRNWILKWFRFADKALFGQWLVPLWNWMRHHKWPCGGHFLFEIFQ